MATINQCNVLSIIPDSIPIPTVEQDIERVEKTIAFFINEYNKDMAKFAVEFNLSIKQIPVKSAIAEIASLAQLPKKIREVEARDWAGSIADDEYDKVKINRYILSYFDLLNEKEKKDIARMAISFFQSLSK